MIVSFYDETFKGLQDNASLVVDNSSYSLIKRAVDLDDLKCRCEAFTENIQPTFLVIKNDRGNYMYGALAGVPQLNAENQTEITASDLKTMFKSDVLLDFSKEDNIGSDVNELFLKVFSEWNEQVNQGSFLCELGFNANVGTIVFDYLKPSAEHTAVYDVWEDIFSVYLKYYGLFMTSQIDLVNKKVIFSIGKSMLKNKNIKLWEMGKSDYGKWIADVNETQGCVLNTATGESASGPLWILTPDNKITSDPAKRKIYPIKRRVVLKETDDSSSVTALVNEASQEALEELTRSMFQENLELENIEADFETKFNLYMRRGDEEPYKSLPCGELHYDANGLVKVQVGFRITGIEFIL